MTTLIEVGRVDELDPQGAIVAIPHSRVALFRVKHRIHAIDDACVRCGSSLAHGKLDGATVTCPKCGWTYDVVTGCVNGIAALHTTVYCVTVRESNVYLDIPVAVMPREC